MSSEVMETRLCVCVYMSEREREGERERERGGGSERERDILGRGFWGKLTLSQFQLHFSNSVSIKEKVNIPTTRKDTVTHKTTLEKEILHTHTHLIKN